MPSPTAQRAFFWQSCLILLPVVALAVAGLVSLRKDRALVEQEARERCQAIADNLGQSLAQSVDQQLYFYANAQFIWASEQEGELGLTSAPEDLTSAQLDSRERIQEWVRQHPNIHFNELPRALWSSLSFDATILSPNDYASPPQPAEWFLNLSDEQRLAWHAIQRAAPAAEGISTNLFDEFMDENPGADAVASAEWLKLSSAIKRLAPEEACPRLIAFEAGHRNVRTESGLPLSHVVMARAFALWPQGLPMPANLLQILPASVRAEPSVLVPGLLDAFERISARDDLARRRAQLLRGIWQTDERTRLVLHAFLARHPPAAWEDRCFWVETALGPFLVSGRKPPASKTPFNTTTNTPAEVLDKRGSYTVFLFPKRLVEEFFIGTFEKSKIKIPDFARGRVIVAGEELLLKQAEIFTPSMPAQHPPLAEFIPSHPPFHMAGGFAFHVDLASADLLYAAQRRRALVFSGFIAFAALTAALGWWQAWRTLRRQIELNELKTNFVSSVSHELRAPIASVRLMAEGLESGRVREDSKRAEYFKFIVQECRRLTSLIENVLDFSRIEQGRKQFDFEPIDPAALVRQTLSLMQTYAQERSIPIEAKINAPPMSCEKMQLVADGRALQQALVNLIDNAIKHSPAGEPVVIGLEYFPEASGQTKARSARSSAPSKPSSASAGSRAKVVHLWVQDRGPGIPREEQARIFERFYRRGSELRRETQGVGIGLSIVKHIVEAHGGCVLVNSAPGQGSRFTVELLLEQIPGANTQ